MCAGFVHPTAIVDPAARLGEHCQIGPFAIIEADVHIGDHCHIGGHVTIHAHTHMGRHNHVYPQAVLGGNPQDLSFDTRCTSTLEIGDGNHFREGVTVNRGSVDGGATRIGCNGYFMNNAHVGHDCVIGNENIFGPGVAIGGHVHIGQRVFFGGGAMVHQFCRIGSFAMIAGVIGVRKDVLPYTLIGGQPVRHYRLNTIGLRRAGVNGARYRALSQAFRSLRCHQAIGAEIADTEEVQHLKQWLQEKSQRGLYGFAGPES